jgi:uncharacterized protein YuzE
VSKFPEPMKDMVSSVDVALSGKVSGVHCWVARDVVGSVKDEVCGNIRVSEVWHWCQR